MRLLDLARGLAGSIGPGSSAVSPFQKRSSAARASAGSGRGASPAGKRDLGVVADRVERLVEIGGPHAGVEQLPQGRRALAALAIQVVAPGPAPLVHLGHLVQLGEARRHAGLHRPLAQQVGAEGVDGAGEEPLEMAQGLLGALPPGGVPLVGQRALQRELEAPAQLRGGLAGEGDGGHLLHLVAAFQHARRHALGPGTRSCRSRRRPRPAG